VPHLPIDDVPHRFQLRIQRLHELHEVHGIADGRERIAQLVRQRGEELVLATVRVPKRLFGALEAGQIEHESHARVTICERGPDEHPHTRAIFPDVLLLDRRVSAGAAQVGDGARVLLLELGWCHAHPVDVAVGEVIPRVADDVQELIVRVLHTAVDVEVEHTEQVRLEQAAEARFALEQRIPVAHELGFDLLAFGDVARGAGHRLDLAACVENGNEEIVVDAAA
jgi:hypothetical protein